MLFLLFYISYNQLFISICNSKSTITFCPALKIGIISWFLHPYRWCYFNIFYKISQWNAGMQVWQDMDVIFNAIYLIEGAVFIFDNAPDVFVEIFLVVWINYRSMVFCTEDNVIKNLPVTTHIKYFLFNPSGVAGYCPIFLAPSFTGGYCSSTPPGLRVTAWYSWPPALLEVIVVRPLRGCVLLHDIRSPQLCWRLL